MNAEVMEDKIETHERRINNHSERLDKLEQDSVEFKIEIRNLCDNIKSLTSILKAILTVGSTALVGFFVYAIEKNIFK